MLLESQVEVGRRDTAYLEELLGKPEMEELAPLLCVQHVVFYLIFRNSCQCSRTSSTIEQSS
jgi:hypothetical protein